MSRTSLTPLRRTALVAALTASVLFVACGDSEDGDSTPTATATATATTTPTATETASPTGTTTGGGAADAPNNVDQAACDPIAALVTSVFPDHEQIRDATAFEIGSEVGQGCRVLVAGDGDQLPTFVEVAQELRSALEAEGWTEDPQFAADGPTGTLSLFEKDGEQAVVAAGVSTKDPSACPANQVISECLEGLEADEILVQGSIILKVQ